MEMTMLTITKKAAMITLIDKEERILLLNKGSFIMLRVLIHEEDLSNLTVYMPDRRASQYMKQKLNCKQN